MTNRTISDSQNASYMDRNGGWIKAVFGCLILASAPHIIERVDPGALASMPWLMWLTFAGLTLGSVSIGFGLVAARTITARIVLFVLSIIATVAAVDALLTAVNG